MKTPPLAQAPDECPICGDTKTGGRVDLCDACQRAYDREAHTDGSIFEVISWAARRARAHAPLAGVPGDDLALASVILEEWSGGTDLRPEAKRVMRVVKAIRDRLSRRIRS